MIETLDDSLSFLNDQLPYVQAAPALPLDMAEWDDGYRHGISTSISDFGMNRYL